MAHDGFATDQPVGVVGALVAIPTVAAIQLVLREVVLPRQDRR
ncbi:hypothetical protein ACTMSW_25840 [Micromonospora sp. BQ11]